MMGFFPIRTRFDCSLIFLPWFCSVGLTVRKLGVQGFCNGKFFHQLFEI